MDEGDSETLKIKKNTRELQGLTAREWMYLAARERPLKHKSLRILSRGNARERQSLATLGCPSEDPFAPGDLCGTTKGTVLEY